MTISRVVVLAVLAGCADPAPPLTPGGYRLGVQADSFWDMFPPRYEVLPGGQLDGHNWADAHRCSTQLAAADLLILTEQLDAADVLGRGDSPVPPCADETSWRIEIDATEGAAADLHNAFVYDDCNGESNVVPEMRTLLDTLSQQIVTAGAAGLCTACPSELESTACYDVAFGVDRFCRGEVWQTCDVGGDGIVVDCDRRPSLECDPTVGWIPAITWSISSPTLYRWNDGVTTVYFLVVSLDVDVVGPPLDITTIVPFVAAADASGAALPFEPITLSSSEGLILTGHQSTTLTSQMPAGSAAYASLALRERPWDQSPYAATVPLTLVDGPPPP